MCTSRIFTIWRVFHHSGKRPQTSNCRPRCATLPFSRFSHSSRSLRSRLPLVHCFCIPSVTSCPPSLVACAKVSCHICQWLATATLSGASFFTICLCADPTFLARLFFNVPLRPQIPRPSPLTMTRSSLKSPLIPSPSPTRLFTRPLNPRAGSRFRNDTRRPTLCV